MLIYGYATGTFSSRKLAAKLHEDVTLRVLAAENYPAQFSLRGLEKVQAEFKLVCLALNLRRMSGLRAG